MHSTRVLPIESDKVPSRDHLVAAAGNESEHARVDLNHTYSSHDTLGTHLRCDLPHNNAYYAHNSSTHAPQSQCGRVLLPFRPLFVRKQTVGLL